MTNQPRPHPLYLALMLCLSLLQPATALANAEMPLQHYLSFRQDPMVEAPVSILRPLAELGYPVDVPDDSGITPLMMAVLRGDTQRANTLVQLGADLERRLPNGDNLMTLALGGCWDQRPDFCRQLTFLDNVKRNRYGAREAGIQWLIEQGLPHPSPGEVLNAHISWDSDLFQWAMERLHQVKDEELTGFFSDVSGFILSSSTSTSNPVLDELTRRGLTLNWRTGFLESALSETRTAGLEGLTAWNPILDVEADLNRPLTPQGETLLMLLVCRNQGQPDGLVQLMLAHGADPNQTNSEGLSARDLARQQQADGPPLGALAPLL